MRKKLKVSAVRTLSAGLLSAACVFGTMAVVPPAQAVTDEEIEAVRAEIEAGQEQLDAASDAYYTALKEQKSAVKKKKQYQAEYKKAERRKAKLQGALKESAKSMYKINVASFIDVLMNMSSFEDFCGLWDTFSDINAKQEQTIEEVRKVSATAAEKKSAAEEQEKKAAEEKKKAQDSYDEAQSIIAYNEEQLATLTAQQQQELYELQLQAMAAEAASQQQVAAAAEEPSQQQAVAEPPASDEGGAADTDNSGASEAATYDQGASESSGGGGSTKASGSYNGDNGTLSRAYSALGSSYRWGASSKGAYDCSGLVSYAVTGSYGHAYTSGSLSQYSAVNDPQPGDVCVTKGGGHCGIYIGNGRMIHAATEGVGVVESDVQGNMKIVRP